MSEWKLVLGIVYLVWIAQLITGKKIEVPTEVIDECFARLQRHNEILDNSPDNAASRSSHGDAH